MFERLRLFTGTVMLASALLPGAMGAVLASQGDRFLEHDSGKEHDDERHRRYRNANINDSWFRNEDVKALYDKECGACHLAYPAHLLPSDSWALIMKNLDDHFGENAELDDNTWLFVLAWLQTNAASPGRRILRLTDYETPKDITSLPWFRNEHDEIAVRMTANNPDTQSLSNCEHCHPDASQGSFDEHKVSVSGRHNWRD
ncbi:MAG: diheme cytochrome c [Pseudomonadales bacterium]|nr:diheme cytochrome c [Pseudomonadales bacterium]